MTPGNCWSRVTSPGSRVDEPRTGDGSRDVDNSGLGTRDSGLAAQRAAAGFTLLELMIVVTIIGILATISQPMYRNAVTKAREAALQENLFVMRDAIDKYYADNEKYPESLEDLVNKKYIRRVPKDPIPGSSATWVVVQETDDKGQPGGISDVKSSSEAVGTDGRKYSEW